MTEKELQAELEKTRKDLKSAEEDAKTHKHYIDVISEEKKWHDEQYVLMTNERDLLEKQIELEHQLVAVQAALAKTKEARKELDEKYMKRQIAITDQTEEQERW